MISTITNIFYRCRVFLDMYIYNTTSEVSSRRVNSSIPYHTSGSPSMMSVPPGSDALLSPQTMVLLSGLEVSVLIATALWATTCCQVFFYWRSKFCDRLFIRCLVRPVPLTSSRSLDADLRRRKQLSFVWYAVALSIVSGHGIRVDSIFRVCETVHTALFWVYLYHTSIISFGDQDKLLEGHWSVNYSVFVHGVVSATIQVNDFLFQSSVFCI